MLILSGVLLPIRSGNEKNKKTTMKWLLKLVPIVLLFYP